MKKIKQIIITSLLVILMLNILNINMAYGLSFSDVKVGSWYYNNLVQLTSRKVIAGYTDGTFKPTGTLTREEFVKMIITTIAPKKYSKIGTERWSMPYLRLAKEYGIIPYDINDIDNLLLPIERQEVAYIISRALNEGYENIDSYKSLIKDYESINEFFKNDVLKVYSKGIIGGYTDGTFGPNNSLTRAEATAIISRMIDSSLRLNNKEKTISYKITEADKTRLRAYTKNQGVGEYKYNALNATIGDLEKQNGIDFETLAAIYVENFMFGFDYNYITECETLSTKLARNLLYQRTLRRYDEYGIYGNMSRDEYIAKTFERIKNEKLIADAIFVPLEDMTYISSDNTIRVRGMVIQKYLNSENSNYQVLKEYKKDIEVEIVVDYELPLDASTLPLGVYRYHNLKAENAVFNEETINEKYNKDVVELAKNFVKEVEYSCNYENLKFEDLVTLYQKHLTNYNINENVKGYFEIHGIQYVLYNYIIGRHRDIVDMKIKQEIIGVEKSSDVYKQGTKIVVPLTVKYKYTSHTDSDIRLNEEYTKNIEVIYLYDAIRKNYFITGYKEIRNN